jgi:PAS domain S-box-containing protein
MAKQPIRHLPILAATLILLVFLPAWRLATDETRWMFAGIAALLMGAFGLVVWHIRHLGHEMDSHEQLQTALDAANAEIESRVASRVAELGAKVDICAANESRLQYANRALRVIAHINETLKRPYDEMTLFYEVCRVLVETGGYRLCWVGSPEGDDASYVRPLVSAGAEADAVKMLRVGRGEERGAGCPQAGQALRSDAPALFRCSPNDGTCNLARRLGDVSVLSLPLPVDDSSAFVLCIYAAEEDAFDSDETTLLAQLAANLSRAVGALRTRDVLAQAKEQSALLLASLPLILYTCRTEGDFGVTYMSPNVEQVTGLAPEHFLTNASFWSGRIHPDDRTRVFDALHGLFKRTKLRHEYRWQVADGSYRWFYDVLHMVRNADGTPSHIAGLWLDITERKEAELALAEAKREIEAAYEMLARKNRLLVDANRARFEFLATLSHELKTPLNAIIGFSEMLKEGLAGNLAPRQQEFLQDIYDAGEKLLALISEILEFAYLEAGQGKLTLELVDARRLLADAVEEFAGRAAATQIALSADTPPELKPSLLDAKGARVILRNLLSNALKFTPSGGGVRAALRVVPREQLQGTVGVFERYLEISVTDTGIGIAPELLPKLFEPFRQANGALTRSYGGVGMGLALVKRLAELNGGAVAAAGGPDQGACFTVWLPYRREFAETDRGGGYQAATEFNRGAEGAPPLGNVRPLALVVEDDDYAAELICLQLHGEGLRTVVARTAEQGLEIAATLRPELITLDILLPGMDGWAFLEQLKHNSILAQIPVVIISIVADQRRGLALGAARVIQKPYQRFELAAALAAIGFAPSANEQRTILVVDDDPDTVKLAAGLLETIGYTVVKAYGGREGIVLARERHPDLIILDLMMPEVTGFDVARALHEHPDSAQIPILVATAQDLSQDEQQELKASVTHVIRKSAFHPEAFLAEVRRALAKPDGKQ